METESTSLSTIPPSALAVGAHHLRRYVIRPYGRGGVAVTLSLWNTARPSAGAATTPFIGYRIYVREPKREPGTHRGHVVWDGDDYVPAPGEDIADVAVQILDRVTTRPGDSGANGIDHASWTPAQLDLALRHGPALRAEARTRLARSPEQLANLRADLEVAYSYRRDIGSRECGDPRHWVRLGRVQASGRTRAEARALLSQAVAHELQHTPQFRAKDGCVYALLADGLDYTITVLHPDRPESPVGDTLRFRASDVDAAARVFETTLARLGTGNPPPPRKRPSARAPRRRPSAPPGAFGGAR